MKLCIATICAGEFYEKLGSTSHKTLEAYAEKCNASFVLSKDLAGCEAVPGYAKLELVRELLAVYDRVLYIDTDILVRFDAPDLFELVPSDAVGMFNECHLFPEREIAKRNFGEQMIPEGRDVEWEKSKRYYNTGVMLVSREHAALFDPPSIRPDFFGEQSYLNWRLHALRFRTFDLPHRFNRLLKTMLASGEHLDDSFLVHFAGAFANGSPKEENYAAWLALAARFDDYRAAGVVPPFPRRLYIDTTGVALGDVVSTEPVVRYIREVLAPEADLTIRTVWPEVFAHLVLRNPLTTVLGPGQTAPDKGHYKMKLFPDPMIANFNLMHPVDYAALAAFRGSVPKAHRRIELARHVEAPIDTSGLALVHPGMSWQSKTFPRAYWQSIIDELTGRVEVAIVGKTYDPGDFRGTVDVDARNCYDLRNRTTLPQLISAIAGARVLVSNDSSPVHIAGAFDTPTVMITTAKEADFIWPHRDPALNIALGRPIRSSVGGVGLVQNTTMDTCTPQELLEALPPVSEVVAAVLKAFDANRSRNSDDHCRRSVRRESLLA